MYQLLVLVDGPGVFSCIVIQVGSCRGGEGTGGGCDAVAVNGIVRNADSKNCEVISVTSITGMIELFCRMDCRQVGLDFTLPVADSLPGWDKPGLQECR